MAQIVNNNSQQGQPHVTIHTTTSARFCYFFLKSESMLSDLKPTFKFNSVHTRVQKPPRLACLAFLVILEKHLIACTGNFEYDVYIFLLFFFPSVFHFDCVYFSVVEKFNKYKSTSTSG